MWSVVSVAQKGCFADVVFNEASIEVAETKESVDLLYICQFRPHQDSVNLFRVHFDPIT